MTVAAQAPSRCRFDGWDMAGAPEVWALRQPADRSTDPLAPPEAERERLRRSARDALRERLAAVFGAPAASIAICHERGRPPRARWQPSARAGDAAIAARLAATGLSISHEGGMSLIAWHGAGPVGVDVVRLGAHADVADLTRVTQLYLGPNLGPAHAHPAPAAIDTEAFLQNWACHEARLKCAGLGLVEWSDALAAALADIRAVAIELPPWAGDAAAAIAWRRP